MVHRQQTSLLQRARRSSLRRPWSSSRTRRTRRRRSRRRPSPAVGWRASSPRGRARERARRPPRQASPGGDRAPAPESSSVADGVVSRVVGEIERLGATTVVTYRGTGAAGVTDALGDGVASTCGPGRSRSFPRWSFPQSNRPRRVRRCSPWQRPRRAWPRRQPRGPRAREVRRVAGPDPRTGQATSSRRSRARSRPGWLRSAPSSAQPTSSPPVSAWRPPVSSCRPAGRRCSRRASSSPSTAHRGPGPSACWASRPLRDAAIRRAQQHRGAL